MRTPQSERGTGGRLGCAIANAVVHLHSEVVGRGPTKAQAFCVDNLVILMMENSLTRGEMSLVAEGHPEAALAVRGQLLRSLRDRLVRVVEDLTGCDVVAFLSGNCVDPDLAAELFVLDRAVPGEALAAGARDAVRPV